MYAATVSSGRTIWPSEQAGSNFHRLLARHLHFGERRECYPTPFRSQRGMPAQAFRTRPPSSRSGTRDGLAIEPVELARVLEERLVALLAHGFENRTHHGLGLRQTRLLRRASKRTQC